MIRDDNAQRADWRNASQWQASAVTGGTPGRGSTIVLGDLNDDGRFDVRDVDVLCSGIRSGSMQSNFDLDGNGQVDDEDLRFMINDIAGTRFGDTNLDGRVDEVDLNAVGVHWQEMSDELSWSDGDFNCDGVIDDVDLNEIGRNWMRGS